MESREEKRRIDVSSRIQEANDLAANENRLRFARAGVTAIDLMGSPGAGKTALLEATIPRLGAGVRAGVVVGDIATTLDAERLERCGVPAVQIVTEEFGGECHLEAAAVRRALDRLDLDRLNLLFIENVGNLVCPAEFDIGQHARVVILSVTEGEDKPLKYPLAFRVADLAVISKIDLSPHLDVDMPALRENIRRVNPRLGRVELSARTGAGLDGWLEWLRRAMNAHESASRERPNGGGG